MEYHAHYEKSPRMWSQGLHAHDYYEIYIHVEGARHYCIDDVIYELKPHQLLIMPPLHMHGLVCDRDLVDYERCYLYLSPETLQKCGMGKENLSELIDASYKNNHMLWNLSENETEKCVENMKRIESLSASGESDFTLEIYSLILQILQTVKNALGAKKSTAANAVSDNTMALVLHYINDNFTKNITVSSISKRFHLSESSLSHKFKEYINKGIYEYILYKRIVLAKELIYTDASLIEIAYKCGFSDYSNFLRAFEKSESMSPKAYKQKKVAKPVQ